MLTKVGDYLTGGTMLWPFNVIFENYSAVIFFGSLLFPVFFNFFPASVTNAQVTNDPTLSKIVPEGMGLVLGAFFRAVPFLYQAAIDLKNTSYSEMFKLLWYDVCIGTIVFVFWTLVCLIIMYGVGYVLNYVQNWFASSSQGIQTTVQFIICLIQVVSAFYLTRWASNSSDSFDVQVLIADKLKQD